MYDRILVPTDGSEHAEAAATSAFDLAAEIGASVFVLSVVDPGPLGTIRLPGEIDSAEAVLEERAEEFVDRLAEEATARDLEVTTAVRRGVPEDEILASAEQVDADVVVMGTRGAGGVGRMMLGSVADAVIRSKAIDVLVVGEE